MAGEMGSPSAQPRFARRLFWHVFRWRIRLRYLPTGAATTLRRARQYVAEAWPQVESSTTARILIQPVYATITFIPRRLWALDPAAFAVPTLYGFGALVLGTGATTIDDFILATRLFSVANIWIVTRVSWGIWNARELQYKIQRIILIGVVTGITSYLHVSLTDYLISKAPIETISTQVLYRALSRLTPDAPWTSITPTAEAETPVAKPAQPSVGLTFVDAKEPSVLVVNESDVIARDIKWALVLWNTEHPEERSPLPIPTRTFDWLKPRGKGGPQNVFGSRQVRPLVKQGDRLIGSANVNCPECPVGHTYIVFVHFGYGGWFAETVSESGSLIVPMDAAGNLRGYFDELEAAVPPESRVPIVDREKEPARLRFK